MQKFNSNSVYPEILALHSLVRWLVFVTLLFAVYRGFKGWLTKKTFSPFDNGVRKWTAIIAQIQLIIGVTLYSISPLVHYFLHHFKTALPEREVRFFGMEHAVVMIAAIVVITIGSIKSSQKKASPEKYKTMAIWYSIGLLMILSSMPLPFSPPPFVRRPFFRAF